MSTGFVLGVGVAYVVKCRVFLFVDLFIFFAVFGSFVVVSCFFFFFFQAEDGIRDHCVTGVQTCALPILTLLAVPVFYSLFDDLARSHIWSRIGSTFSGVLGRARRRAATAAASLLGIT